MKFCLIVIDTQESLRHRPFFTEHGLPAYLAGRFATLCSVDETLNRENRTGAAA